MSNHTITDATIVDLSPHCLERYRERFRPALDSARADEELVRLVDHAQIQADAPAWVSCTRPDVVAWLVLGDDMALPLVPDRCQPDVLVATTCLARGSLSPEARQRRNAHGRRRRPGRGPRPIQPRQPCGS